MLDCLKESFLTILFIKIVSDKLQFLKLQYFNIPERNCDCERSQSLKSACLILAPIKLRLIKSEPLKLTHSKLEPANEENCKLEFLNVVFLNVQNSKKDVLNVVKLKLQLINSICEKKHAVKLFLEKSLEYTCASLTFKLLILLFENRFSFIVP